MLAVAACAGEVRPAPVPSAPGSVAPAADSPVLEEEPTTLATGLAAPWSVVPLASGGALISQRDDGAVLELAATGELRTVGAIADVASGGESGLHGLALLDAGTQPWLYAYHGAADDNRVVRMPLLGVEGALRLGDAEVVIDGIARARTHNGGRIAFGPDGYLYVATGDAGNPERAQDPSSPNGKILRLTPEGDAAPGNPFGTAVWSLGHRNVQGLAWTSDGSLWASEFGQNAWDEVNVIVPGGNYGWPIVEGIAGDERFVDPAIAWRPDEASPSGMAAIDDTLFVAGLRGERLWMLQTAGTRILASTALLAGEEGRLRDAVATPDGGLWVLTNNTDGRGAAEQGDDRLLYLPQKEQ